MKKHLHTNYNYYGWNRFDQLSITKQKKEEAAQDNVENARENLDDAKEERCRCKEATHEEWDGA
jgi:hypothetical protein